MGFSLSKLWVEIAAKRDGFDKAIDDVDARMERSAETARGLAADTRDALSASGSGKGLGGAVAAASPFEGMAGEIQGAFSRALVPLEGFASRFESNFQRVGGTIVTLARRIDGYMKFPAFERFVGIVRDRAPNALVRVGASAVLMAHKVSGAFANMGDVAGRNLNKVYGGPAGGAGQGITRVLVDLTGVVPASRAAAAAVGSLTSQYARLAGVAGAAGGIGAFFVQGIKGATSLNANLSKTGVIFGEQGRYIVQAADEMAERFGVVKQEYIEAATNFAAVFKGVGKGNGEAVGMGNNLARLAADMASFSGKPVEQAIGAIGAALRGEMDPIEQFGVYLTEAEIQGEALRAGYAKSAKEIDTTAKKMAAYNLILSQTGAAQGDLARTAGDPDNQFKKLTGNLTNLATTVGTHLLPTVNEIVTAVNGWMSSLNGLASGGGAVFSTVSGWATTAKSLFIDLGGGISDAFARVRPALDQAFGGDSAGVLSGWASQASATIGGFVDGLGLMFRNLPDFLEVAAIKMTEVIINLGEWFGALTENASMLGGYIATNWRALMLDGLNAVAAGFRNLIDNLVNLGSALVTWLQDPTKGFDFNWTPLLAGFEATAAKLPELAKPHLTSLQDQIDAKLQAIGEREAKRVEATAKKIDADVKAASPMKGDGTPVPTRPESTKKDEFKSESFSGAEFARKLQAGINGGADKTPQKQLTALESIQKSTSAMAKAVNKPKVAVLG